MRANLKNYEGATSMTAIRAGPYGAAGDCFINEGGAGKGSGGRIRLSGDFGSMAERQEAATPFNSPAKDLH
jgi:hypothetical protein